MVQRVITFHYTLTDTKGEVIDSSDGADPLTYLEGASQIIPGLEKAIQSMKVGDTSKLTIEASQAYGERNDAHVISVPRSEFPEGAITVGDRFQAGDEEQGTLPLTVVKVTDEEVTLDANHPLAGMDLTFDVNIVEIRDATKEELEHGHVHDECCHTKH